MYTVLRIIGHKFSENNAGIIGCLQAWMNVMKYLSNIKLMMNTGYESNNATSLDDILSILIMLKCTHALIRCHAYAILQVTQSN